MKNYIKSYISMQYTDGTFPSSDFAKRDIYADVMDYLLDAHSTDKICAVYGLRRTGKTTIMEQCADSLFTDHMKKSVFLTCSKKSDFDDVLKVIDAEIQNGYKYFFIDEITYAEGFQNMGAVLSDIFVKKYDARIVVCGTHSLGLALASEELMYDRIKFVNTTYTTYPEYSRLKGISDIDLYIKFGSTLNNEVFLSHDSCNMYINTSVVNNIINSLEKSEGIKRYPAALTELYENEELESVIQRRINTYSQDVTVKALRKAFRSAPITATIKNFNQPTRNERIEFSDYFDLERANTIIAAKLGIVQNPAVALKDNHLRELNSYLNSIGVFLQIPVYESFRDNLKGDDLQLMIHSGMAHANIRYALEAVDDNSLWKTDTPSDIKARLKTEAENYALGLITEDVVTANVYSMLTNNPQKVQNTFSSESKWYVSKLRVKGKEIDTLVYDKEQKNVFLFEVKHSKENVPSQSKNLENEDFLEYINENFGEIIGRAVLYMGETDASDVIPRISASDFLKMIYTEKDDMDFSMEQVLTSLSPKNIGRPVKDDAPSGNSGDIDNTDSYTLEP